MEASRRRGPDAFVVVTVLGPLAQTDGPTEGPVEQVKGFAETFAEAFGNIPWVTVAFRALTAAIVLVIAAIIVRFAKRWVRGWVSRSTARGLAKMRGPAAARAGLRAQTLGDVMADVTAVVLWVIALFTALGQIGIELAPLIAGAGIAGVALGFGAQSLVKDFFSGFFILLEDQFGVGDVIQVEPEVSGVVEDISLRVTRLRSLDGTVWFVPNGEVRYLANKSKEWARALVDFSVGYEEDVEEVMHAIRVAAERLRQDEEFGPKILEDVEILGVEQLAESGVTIRCYIKTQPLEQWKVSRRFRQEVKREFDRRSIEIPFPHRKLIIEDGAFPRSPGAQSTRTTKKSG